ncbi:unnamed protein product [Echinostoma caproni]|uniref:Vezatin domain-containing protein n=1 Tax=Echinostoma caproni TaxID=27848 RepID=A0A183AN51_9TREM|nr:unnamed protein product [Echinostoma caproni]
MEGLKFLTPDLFSVVANSANAHSTVCLQKGLVLIFRGYYFYLERHPEPIYSSLTDSVISLVTSIEKWVILASWLILGLYLHDKRLIVSVGETIRNRWMDKLEHLEECLIERDDLCANAFGKLHVGLNEIRMVVDSITRHTDASSYLDALNGSFSEPFEIISRCQDLFDGEPIIQLDEKLHELKELHTDWLKLISVLSLFHPEEDKWNEAENRATSEINQRIRCLLNSARIRVHGENGIAQIINVLKNEIELWVQKGQQLVDCRNVLMKSKQAASLQQTSSPDMGLNVEQLFRMLEFDIEPLRASLNTWDMLTNQAINAIGLTEKNDSAGGLSARQSIQQSVKISTSGLVDHEQQSNVVLDETLEINSLCCTSYNRQCSSVKKDPGEEWSSCPTHVLLWLNRMEKSVPATYDRRLDEVNLIAERLVEDLVNFICPDASHRSQPNSGHPAKEAATHDREISGRPCSMLTNRLIKGLWTKLSNDRIEGYESIALSEQRINYFQFLAQKICEYAQIFGSNGSISLDQLKKIIVNFMVSRNLAQMMNERRGIPDKLTVLRYLQSTDQTIRETSVLDASDGGPFHSKPVEQGVELPSDLPQTAMAYAGVQELEQVRKNLNTDEIRACEAEENALIEEKALYAELDRTKTLREQIQTKSEILNRIKLLKEETATALEDP